MKNNYIYIEQSSVDLNGDIHYEGESGYNPMGPTTFQGINVRERHKIPNRSISDELEVIMLPNKFKAKAALIFSDAKVPTRRKKKRKMIIFYCLLVAYKELEEIEFPEIIARAVGLDMKDMSKALLMEEFFPGYDISSINYKPQDFISRCISIISDEMFIYLPEDDIMALANRVVPEIGPQLGNPALQLKDPALQLKDPAVKLKDPAVKLKDPASQLGVWIYQLKDAAPQKVALSICVYYMKTRGIEFDMKKIYQIISKTEGTVNNFVKIIALVDNNSF